METSRPRRSLRRQRMRPCGLVVVAVVVTLMATVASTQARIDVTGTPTTATPVASPMASPAATPHIRMISVTDTVTIELTDSGFNPSVVQATNGHDLTVTLINTGSRRHAFQIDRLDVDVSLEPGEQQTITITTPPLGDFTIVSDAPGDEHWSGTLIFYI